MSGEWARASERWQAIECPYEAALALLHGDEDALRHALEALRLLEAGLRNAQIAERLMLSQRTVDPHVSAILRKLDAGTRGEASAEAVRLGLTSAR
jgi:DNA-binding NarL/FixJ family response regulator